MIPNTYLLYPVFICVFKVPMELCMSMWFKSYTKNGPMMTSSNGNIFRVTGPLCNSSVAGEFPSQRPVMRSQNKRWSKQSWLWSFETPLRSLWRHCNTCLSYGGADKRHRVKSQRVITNLIGTCLHKEHAWMIKQMPWFPNSLQRFHLSFDPKMTSKKIFCNLSLVIWWFPQSL